MPEVYGMWFHEDSHPRVRELLWWLYDHRHRVRIYYGDQFPPFRDWGDRPMRGLIGRSMGPQRIPLLIPNIRSHGGEAILDHCIIRIEPSPSNGGAYFDIRQDPPPYRGIGPWAPREAVVRRLMDPDEAAVWSDHYADEGNESLTVDYKELQRLKDELEGK